MLFIGKLDKYKGSDKLIKVYQILKNNYDLCLVIVGASEIDEYYEQAFRSGAIILPRQPHKNLRQFYQSADIFVMPGSMQYNRWGGIGINTIEALACNIPVITGTLGNFLLSNKQVGILASSVSEITNAIDYILKNHDKFKDCRNLAQKYFDWKPIINNTYQIYKDLFNKYYNIKLTKTNE